MTGIECRTDLEGFCARLAGVIGPADNGDHTVFVTRAPAVVDVMGGAAEQAGGLVLQGSLDVAVLAAANLRDDRQVSICRLADADGAITHHFPVELLFSDDSLDSVDVGAGPWSGRVRAMLALLREFALQGLSPDIRRGLTIIVHTNWPDGSQVDLTGALLAAVVEAVSQVLRLKLEPLPKALMCKAAAGSCGGSCGARVPLAALLSDASSLLLVQTQPHSQQSLLPMPEGVGIAALETELDRSVKPERHDDTRIAAAMGHLVIRELIGRDGRGTGLDATYLSNVVPTEFVERFRDRIPTKLTGQAFLDRFGDVPGLPAGIDPARIYKIRSRAEHFIYENRRVHEFSEAIIRARRSNDEKDLIRAGETMYASHWSYSQRCGIGAVETDRIATALRSDGPERGFFGAKVTGFGKGGGMVVLMRTDPQTTARFYETIGRLERDLGKPIRVFSGSAAGAARTGARQLARVGEAVATA